MTDADQSSTTRRFSAWLGRPWPTRKLIGWLIGVWIVLTAINLIVFDIGWAGVARGTVALLIVGGLGVIWNERRWRRSAGLRE